MMMMMMKWCHLLRGLTPQNSSFIKYLFTKNIWFIVWSNSKHKSIYTICMYSSQKSEAHFLAALMHSPRLIHGNGKIYFHFTLPAGRLFTNSSKIIISYLAWFWCILIVIHGKKMLSHTWKDHCSVLLFAIAVYIR